MIDLLKFASNDQLFSFIDFHFVLERFSEIMANRNIKFDNAAE